MMGNAGENKGNEPFWGADLGYSVAAQPEPEPEPEPEYTNTMEMDGNLYRLQLRGTWTCWDDNMTKTVVVLALAHRNKHCNNSAQSTPTFILIKTCNEVLFKLFKGTITNHWMINVLGESRISAYNIKQ